MPACHPHNPHSRIANPMFSADNVMIAQEAMGMTSVAFVCVCYSAQTGASSSNKACCTHNACTSWQNKPLAYASTSHDVNNCKIERPQSRRKSGDCKETDDAYCSNGGKPPSEVSRPSQMTPTLQPSDRWQTWAATACTSHWGISLARGKASPAVAYHTCI